MTISLRIGFKSVNHVKKLGWAKLPQELQTSCNLAVVSRAARRYPSWRRVPAYQAELRGWPNAMQKVFGSPLRTAATGCAKRVTWDKAGPRSKEAAAGAAATTTKKDMYNIWNCKGIKLYTFVFGNTATKAVRTRTRMILQVSTINSKQSPPTSDKQPTKAKAPRARSSPATALIPTARARAKSLVTNKSVNKALTRAATVGIRLSCPSTSFVIWYFCICIWICIQIDACIHTSLQAAEIWHWTLECKDTSFILLAMLGEPPQDMV